MICHQQRDPMRLSRKEKTIMKTFTLTAWTSWFCPSRESKISNRCTGALVILKHPQRNTSIGCFTLVNSKILLFGDLILIPTSKLQRTRLHNCNLTTSGTFKLLAFFQILFVRARVGKIRARRRSIDGTCLRGEEQEQEGRFHLLSAIW